MSNHQTDGDAFSFDELWLRGWADEGLAALERYLGNHAAFADFLAAREKRRSNSGPARV